MKKKGNPIYGLACPSTQLIKFSEKEKKCGCTIEYPIKPLVDQTISSSNYSSQIFNSITNAPFDTQVHILNLTNGQGTVTQPNGQFVIQALPSDLLQITHVGFGEVTVKASELTDKIVLDETSEDLDEVIISSKPQKAGLALLGLAIAFGVIYASSDDDKKTS